MLHLFWAIFGPVKGMSVGGGYRISDTRESRFGIGHWLLGGGGRFVFAILASFLPQNRTHVLLLLYHKKRENVTFYRKVAQNS